MAAWILAVLASIAIGASVLAVWLHETVLDTDRFMNAVTPAIEGGSAGAVLGGYLADELISALAIPDRVDAALAQVNQTLTEGMGETLELTPSQRERLQLLDLGLARLAGPIAAGLEARIRDAVDAFATSPRATELLLAVTERAHERTVLLLRDELDQLPNLVVEQGEVQLNLVPVAAEALRSVINGGVEVAGLDREIPPFTSAEDAEAAVDRLAGLLGVELAPGFGQVPVMSETRLSQYQDTLRTFDRLVWLLVGVAVVLAVLAIVTAPSIARGILRVGIGATLALVMGLLIAVWATDQLAAAARSADARTAIVDVTGALVGSLQRLVLLIAVVAIGVAVAAYVVDRRDREALGPPGS